MTVENTDEMLQEALYGLLERRPLAQIAAFDPHAVRVPVPESLGLAGHPELPFRALVDLVPRDRATVIAIWERARATGSAVGTARLFDGTFGQGYLVDLCRSHGVLVLALDVITSEVGEDGGKQHSLEVPLPSRPPRLSRVRKNELSVILEVDEATVVGFGWSEEELVGRRTLELIHPDDQDRGITNWLEMLAAPGLTHRWKGRHLCKDGSYRWMEFVNTNRLDTDEGIVLTEMVDISDEMEAREALEASERLFKGLAEALPIGVAQVTPEGAVVFSNEQLARTLRSSAPTTVDQLRDDLVEADRVRFDRHWRTLVADGLGGVGEYELSDGRAVEIVARPLTAGDGDDGLGATPPRSAVGAVICVSDISERVHARRDLERRARIDPLTQVLNRNAIEEHLSGLMSGSATSGVAVVFIDIDGFKRVNDDLGHAVGDVTLSEIGDRLRAAVRARGDQVGRIGGDEFVVVCAEVTDVAQATLLRERIDQRLNDAPTLAGDRAVRASVGVAWTEDSGIGPLELMRMADQDMYRVKRARISV